MLVTSANVCYVCNDGRVLRCMPYSPYVGLYLGTMSVESVLSAMSVKSTVSVLLFPLCYQQTIGMRAMLLASVSSMSPIFALCV